ncbi:MAG: SIS domain-containing protein [Cyanobacteria bacterium P01_D01_bin.56]
MKSSFICDQLTLEQAARIHILNSIEVQQQVTQFCLDSIVLAAQVIAQSIHKGGKLLLCGNGGSAADCQHLAGEFINCLSKDFRREGLPAIALTTDTSILTSIANDSGYTYIFERQVRALGQRNDVLLGISTSGNSANVVQAVKTANQLGLSTVALTGEGKLLGEIAEVAIQVPHDNTQHIQEAHLVIEHILCRLVEIHLFEERGL